MRAKLERLYRHKWIVILCILIIVIVSGVLMFMMKRPERSSLYVKRGDIVEGVYGLGTVLANKSYQLRSGILSTITGVHIREGDQVKSGDHLLDLDGKTYHAPFSGTVTYFPYKTGENVSSQVVILVLIDSSDRYLVVDLEQEAALRVKPGQTAVLSFDSIREQNFEGKVESVYSQGQNFLARIDIANLPRVILPGMTADVAIAISTHKNALLIPVVALDGNQVHVIKGYFQQARPEKVKIGVSDTEMAEVLESDLKPGDELQIITKPEE